MPVPFGELDGGARRALGCPGQGVSPHEGDHQHRLHAGGSPRRVFRRRQINKVTLKLFDKTVWFWRRVDGLMPWPGLSLIAIARRAD